MLSRSYKDLFHGENGELRRSAEHVLADLRDFTGVTASTIFDNDPLVMARREGRREVGQRIINLLNLDESTVRKIMELDDGIGE